MEDFKAELLLFLIIIFVVGVLTLIPRYNYVGEGKITASYISCDEWTGNLQWVTIATVNNHSYEVSDNFKVGETVKVYHNGYFSFAKR